MTSENILLFFVAFLFPGTLSFFLRQTAVCCSRWSPTKCLCSVTRTVQGKLSGWTEKTEYFDPLTYFCLNEMWGTDNRGEKKINLAQTHNSIEENYLLIDRSPLMPVSVLMSFVLHFLDKVELWLDPFDYSLAYFSSCNLRRQITMRRMSLRLPLGGSCGGTWWPTICARWLKTTTGRQDVHSQPYAASCPWCRFQFQV